MYSATYYPPPGSDREPHVGFNTEIPALGGCTGGELEALEADTKEDEFVEVTLRFSNCSIQPFFIARRSSNA